jgi:hypothetical protein
MTKRGLRKLAEPICGPLRHLWCYKWEGGFLVQVISCQHPVIEIRVEHPQEQTAYAMAAAALKAAGSNRT